MRRRQLEIFLEQFGIDIKNVVEIFFDEENRVHQDHDMYAVATAQGDRYWFVHGVLRRESLDSLEPPAVRADGTPIF